MIKIENIQTCGWEPAIRGMRNPMNSWEKSDSQFLNETDSSATHDILGTTTYHNGITSWKDYKYFITHHGVSIGPDDLRLMLALSGAGPDHRKFMRMIVVYMDITAPLYWWKEFETYKVGTVCNSCSTMHTIHKKEFELDDFSFSYLARTGERVEDEIEARLIPIEVMFCTIECLNVVRDNYLKTHDKTYWYQLIQLLPSSYNQRRTIMLNYEVLHNIYTARKNHELDEWQEFCRTVKEELPYSALFTSECDDEPEEEDED